MTVLLPCCHFFDHGGRWVLTLELLLLVFPYLLELLEFSVLHLDIDRIIFGRGLHVVRKQLLRARHRVVWTGEGLIS